MLNEKETIFDSKARIIPPKLADFIVQRYNYDNDWTKYVLRDFISEVSCLIRQARFVEAIDLCSRNNLHFYVETFCVAAICYMNLRYMKDAFVLLQEAFKMDNHDTVAWFLMGCLHEIVREKQKAIDAYEKVLCYAECDLLEFGFAATRQFNLKPDIKIYTVGFRLQSLRKAINRYPNKKRHIAYWEKLANRYALRDSHRQAITAHERVLAIIESIWGIDSVKSYGYLGNLAWSYFQTGQFEIAEEFWIRALNIITKYRSKDNIYRAYYMTELARLYNILGRYQDAVELCKEALKIKEGKKDKYLMLSITSTLDYYSVAAKKLGDVELAESLRKRHDEIFDKFLNRN